MTANFVETVTGSFSPDMIESAAGTIGQSTSTTRNAVRGAVPTILAGLTQAVSTEGGSSRVFAVLSQIGAGGGLGGMGSALGQEGMLGNLLGEGRASAITDLIAGHSGMPRGSSSRLLTWLTPVIAGMLGKEVAARRLNARGLTDMLAGQKKAILDDPHTPPGLAGALGLQSLGDLGGPAARVEEPTISTVSLGGGAPAAARPVAHHEEPVYAHPHAHRRSRWGIGLPIALIAGALIIWGLVSFTRHRVSVSRRTSPQVEAPRAEAPPAPPAEAPRAGSPNNMDINPPAGAPNDMTEKLKPTGGAITLPGGQALAVDPKSREAELAHAIADKSANAPKTISLDDINFETGSTNVVAGEKNLDTVAQILKAYPSARIRLEGHADSMGSPATNETLSRERAEAIKGMLVQRGVDDSRIETAGKSDEEPVGSNDTEEGRMKNRRVDVTVLSQ